MGDLLAPILQDPTFVLARQLCTLFFVVFSLALVFWTWRDARKRGAMPWFWALVVLIFNLAGWAVYMVVRPPEYLEDIRERELEILAKEASLNQRHQRCPSCLKPVGEDFLICPNCMTTLRRPCTECERPLDMDWAVCPYCKERQTPVKDKRGKASGKAGKPAQSTE